MAELQFQAATIGVMIWNCCHKHTNMDIHGLNVPDAIVASAIGAITGALASIGGIVLNDWRNNIRLKIQNAHTEKLASDARDHALKKEILLSIPGTLNKFHTALGGLASSETLELAQEAFVEFSTVMGKVMVVATTETVCLAANLNAFLCSFYLKSITKWVDVRGRRDEFQSAQHAVEKSTEKLILTHAEYAKAEKLLHEENGNPIEVSKLYGELEVALAESKKRRDEMDSAERAFNEMEHQFSSDMIATLQDFDQLTVPLLISVRSELGVATDEEQLRNVLRAQKEIVLQATQSALRDAQANRTM